MPIPGRNENRKKVIAEQRVQPGTARVDLRKHFRQRPIVAKFGPFGASWCVVDMCITVLEHTYASLSMNPAE